MRAAPQKRRRWASCSRPRPTGCTHHTSTGGGCGDGRGALATSPQGPGQAEAKAEDLHRLTENPAHLGRAALHHHVRHCPPPPAPTARAEKSGEIACKPDFLLARAWGSRTADRAGQSWLPELACLGVK